MTRTSVSISGGRQTDKHWPQATVSKGGMTWWLWLIPAGAIAVCIWFVYRDYVATGPLITIYFESVEGLEAGNTQIMHRGAQIGQVKSVSLTPDSKLVKVTARLAGSAKNVAREGALFWVVRPEVRVGMISGLRTLVSGEYIATEPGTGAPTNSFSGLGQPPAANRPNALQIRFIVDQLGSLGAQSAIFYRGVQVGDVTKYELEEDGRHVVIDARIWREYAPLVRVDSKFWNAGGLDVHLGIFSGVQISAESTKTLISGGIEFATPPNYMEAATNGATFDIAAKVDDKWKTWDPSIPLQLSAHASITKKAPPGIMVK